jgi:adenylate kinase family enzyme
VKIGFAKARQTPRRIAVIGPGGAGKSVLATEISRRTGLPVVHLDPIFWGEGWTRAAADQVRPAVEAAIASDRWILDGNFLWDQRIPDDRRFDRADTVVFLDLPRTTCLWRVLRRLARDRGRRRPDLPEGCGEGVDLDLLCWIWRYPKTDRPRVLELLDGLEETVTVRRLRSPSDVRRFLDSL